MWENLLVPKKIHQKSILRSAKKNSESDFSLAAIIAVFIENFGFNETFWEFPR